MGAPVVRLQQAIHGYRTGHQLLQSSRQLPSDVQRFMLVMSDLSGPSLVPGFEEYVTGYPLEEIGTYVLARTWYAPEMERPGCVWTHSLLVEYADLARIEDLALLTRYFQRPSRRESGNTDLPPIEFEPLPATSMPSTHLSSTAWLSCAVYGSPSSPVVVLRPSARDLEGVVLALWSQQWPRLRRNFRFCTGALSVGAHETTSFDLVVAPASLANALRRDAPTALFVDEAGRELLNWPPAAAYALAAPRRFRDFSWEYGADVSHPRRAWMGLAEACAWMDQGSVGRPNAAEAVGALAKNFPAREDALRLKSELLFEGSGRQLYPQADVLAALATSEGALAFDPKSLNLDRRARSLWDDDRSGASTLLQRLVRERLNPTGEAILASLCDAVGPSTALDLERQERGLLPLLIFRSPRLAQSPSLWAVPVDRQREMLFALGRVGTEAVRDALGAILSAGANDLSTDVARLLGPGAAQAILNALDADDKLLQASLGHGWQTVLAHSPAAVIEWLAKAPPSADRLAVATSVMDPHDQAVGQVPIDRWVELAGVGVAKLSADAQFRVRAFLLAVALASRVPGADQLVAKTYGEVFQASARDAVPYAIWRWFDQLPSRKWWRTWDHCERLSMALVERFSRRGWELQHFVEASRESDAFAQALAVVDDVPAGQELLEKLQRAVRRGDLTLTSSQADALRRR